MAQHPGQCATDADRAARQGRPGRLLDLQLHQLPAGLPHLEAWDRAYRAAGLVIIGVHTPEFAFEHVTDNVSAQARALGVEIPGRDRQRLRDLERHANQYWPADYLIDSAGVIRDITFGEGGYADTENLIRQLLTTRQPAPALPPATEVADTTPTQRPPRRPTSATSTHHCTSPVPRRRPGTGNIPIPRDTGAGHVRPGRRLEGRPGSAHRRARSPARAELPGRQGLLGARRPGQRSVRVNGRPARW